MVRRGENQVEVKAQNYEELYPRWDRSEDIIEKSWEKYGTQIHKVHIGSADMMMNGDI
jgi:hypothetical protein